jgi:hypothetical protein
MKKIIALFTLLPFAYFGYAADRTRESQIDDIREAVFRYQFDHITPAERDAKLYVLGVGESCSDPSDEFLKRFAGHQPPVKKASASDWFPDKGRVDKETGGKALMFCAANIAWISDTDVEVSGAHYSAMAGVLDDYFTVKREDGKWKVTEVNNKWKRRVLTH